VEASENIVSIKSSTVMSQAKQYDAPSTCAWRRGGADHERPKVRGLRPIDVEAHPAYEHSAPSAKEKTKRVEEESVKTRTGGVKATYKKNSDISKPYRTHYRQIS